MTRPWKGYTKKEELRILDKLSNFLHGEDCRITNRVMRKVILMDYDGLYDLRKKYLEKMKNGMD